MEPTSSVAQRGGSGGRWQGIHTHLSWALVCLSVLLAFFTVPHSLGTPPVVNAVVNAASYSGGAIAPGEMLVIFGTGLGPAQLSSGQPGANGGVGTSLAGVGVTFNGISSPLIYVSATQIAVMAPYELAGAPTAQLQVSYGGASSQPFPVKITPTMPGIYSADTSGAGNAAALNADGSLNGPQNPAQPGSVVTFYFTGAGLTTPAGVDGNVAQGQSSINAPVSVTMGGVTASVSYAGGAAGQVDGFARIDAVVPSSLAYGGSLPLFVQVGNVTSQPGLTIAVAGSPAPLSVVTGFSANANTISTSEGAPYGDCDFWASGSICTNQSNFAGYGPTKIMRLYICLSGPVTISSCSQNPPVTGPLSAAMLAGINSGISAYAGTGIRLLIRFTYNFGPIGPGAQDAPLSVILAHIDQLAPILLQNKDLIFGLQAGFIGTWGEWHDSTNGNDTAAAHQAVLDKELSYFSGMFPILERSPGILMAYDGNTTPNPNIGIHDDYYASSSDDAGTWTPCDTSVAFCFPNDTEAQILAYGAAVSTSSMLVGEFGAVYTPLQTCSALDAFSYMLHPQSIGLNPYPANIGSELENEGCGLSFYNQVGTRIVLQRAAISGNPVPGGQLSVALTLTNAGYGRVIRARPATLVLIENGQTVAQTAIPLQNLDLRTLASFTSETFQFPVTLPATLPAGAVSAALLIPDPATTLSANAAYALPLNSLDPNGNSIFDPGTGYNYLDGSGPAIGPQFQFPPAGGFTSNPSEVVDGTYSIKGSYSGSATYTPYLETAASALPLSPNHSYKVTFRYKILATPSNGFEVLFYSPTGAAAGNFLPSVTFNGQAGATGTETLTNTLGPYSDYQARWDIPGTGAIAIDDIQIIDAASGKVIAGANAEPGQAPAILIVP